MASAPSKMALPTSETSARVGRGFVVIDSSICVATMTGLPTALHLRMIFFWMTGTSSAGTSTPRSPRATMMPSETARISSKLLTPARFSIFGMISMWPPCFAIRLRISSTSEGRWMNDAATKSMSFWMPKMMSRSSCSEIAGRLSSMPGAATRLRVDIGPLFWIVVTMSLPRISSTMSPTRPSERSSVSPGFTSL